MEKMVLTFAGLPFCKDLESMDADIALIGIPYGTPYPALPMQQAFAAPAAIRHESVRYPEDAVAWDFDFGGTLLGDTGVRVVDCGDLPGRLEDATGNRAEAQQAIKQILKAGAVPLVLGGDDSVPIPVLCTYEDQPSFHLIQLDAHIDWRDQVDGVWDGYSSTMRRASELPWVTSITQVGIRGVGSAREEEYHAALAYGATIITSYQVMNEGIAAVMDHISEGERCFLTMDFDAIDPSVMPAVGAPTPGGLNYAHVIGLIHALAEKIHIVGACLVELLPDRDINQMGTITAMRVAWNLIAALARGNKKFGKR